MSPKIVLKVNGKKAMNGKRYGLTINLDTSENPVTDATIWEFAHAALYKAEEDSQEMQIPDSLCLVVLGEEK